MTNRTIRKAAILISTLDSASGDALLQQMEPELAERVRNAIMDLDQVLAVEEEQVISDFLNRPAESPDGAVELDPALKARLSNPGAKDAFPPLSRTQERPFEFLRDAEPSILADYLSKEHPQTAAVVISHLVPEQAALVLEQMPPETSTETLSRMAWLDDLSPEVLADVERELRSALLPKLHRPERRLASVQAVLAAVRGARRGELLERLAERDQGLAAQLGIGGRAESDFHYRLEPPPLLAEHDPPVRDAPTSGRGGRAQDYLLAAEDFEELFTLGDRELRRVFSAVDASLLVLALTGVEEKFTRRILRGLPMREADILRQQLSHPGPLRLRDIEEAQREVMHLAQQLAARGEIKLRSRAFAAAV